MVVENVSNLERDRIKMGAYRLIDIVILFFLLGSAQAAHATANSIYQIAWMIPAFSTTENENWVRPDRPVLQTRLLPERLFQTDQEIVSSSGLKLLAPSAQLVWMDHRQPMLCSLERGSAPYRSQHRRICFLDQNGDGLFDSYFDRSHGRSTMMTDGLWFAMIGAVPRRLSSAVPFRAREIENDSFSVEANVAFIYQNINDGPQETNFRADIAGRNGPFSVCRSYVPPESARGQSRPRYCNQPGFNVAMLARRGEDVLFSVRGVGRPVRVRFVAQFGSLLGPVTTGMTLAEFDPLRHSSP